MWGHGALVAGAPRLSSSTNPESLLGDAVLHTLQHVHVGMCRCVKEIWEQEGRGGALGRVPWDTCPLLTSGRSRPPVRCIKRALGDHAAPHQRCTHMVLAKAGRGRMPAMHVGARSLLTRV